MNVTTSDVRQALAALGSDAEQIHATLANKGIKALPQSGEYCALSLYLKGQFPEVKNLWTGRDRVGCGATMLCDLTPVQQDFVVRFDHGWYEDLVVGLGGEPWYQGLVGAPVAEE